MAKLTAISLVRLRNDESYTFHKAVSELASAVTAETVRTFAETYAAAFLSLKAAIDESAGQSAAAAARDADSARDEAWRGANAYIRCAAAYHPDDGARRAAAVILSLFEKYGNPTELSLAAETGVIDNLVESVGALDAALIEESGFAVWIDALKARQEDYETAAKASVDDRAAKIVGAVKSARSACDDAYSALAAIVNALAPVAGDATLNDFISRANVVIERQKTVLKTRSALSSRDTGGAE